MPASVATVAPGVDPSVEGFRSAEGAAAAAVIAAAAAAAAIVAAAAVTAAAVAASAAASVFIGYSPPAVGPGCCSQCLRGLARSDEVSGPGAPPFLRPDLWPEAAAGGLTSCLQGCGESYCCDRCRKVRG